MWTMLGKSEFNIQECPIWAIPQIRRVVRILRKTATTEIISFELDSFTTGKSDSCGVLHLIHDTMDVSVLLHKVHMNDKRYIPLMWAV